MRTQPRPVVTRPSTTRSCGRSSAPLWAPGGAGWRRAPAAACSRSAPAPAASCAGTPPAPGSRRLSPTRAWRRGAGRAAAPVTVVEGVAESLPFAAASFETAVTSFSFCTVADPAAVLGELRRVLTPGGRLLMLEHVHLSWEPGRRLQSWACLLYTS